MDVRIKSLESLRNTPNIRMAIYDLFGHYCYDFSGNGVMCDTSLTPIGGVLTVVERCAEASPYKYITKNVQNCTAEVFGQAIEEEIH